MLELRLGPLHVMTAMSGLLLVALALFVGTRPPRRVAGTGFALFAAGMVVNFGRYPLSAPESVGWILVVVSAALIAGTIGPHAVQHAFPRRIEREERKMARARDPHRCVEKEEGVRIRTQAQSMDRSFGEDAVGRAGAAVDEGEGAKDEGDKRRRFFHEIYRAGIESAMRDGVVPERDRDAPATLAQELGLGAKDALEIERGTAGRPS
jgi:hypothetical protein